MERIFDEDRRIGISIGFPVKFSFDEFHCAFKTYGLIDNIEGRAVGIDEIQSLINAMMRLEIFLKHSKEYIEGSLRWEGQQMDGDLGLSWNITLPPSMES